MIEIKNLIKRYPGEDKSAIDSINLSINTGEIFGVIGRSGAGKSTLVRCLNLLEKPSSGSVCIEGQEMTGLNESALRSKRKQIGMIFQHFNLLSSRTVFSNIALPLELSGWPKTKIKEKVIELLELVGLTEKKNNYPEALSGGQKQRVAIARALALDPKLLLSDEATSALDPETTQSILKLLKKINQQLGITIVMITHEMEVVKSICDKVAVLDAGKVAETGEVLSIFANPKTTIAKKLTQAAMNLELPESIQEKLQAEPTAGKHPIIRVAFVGDSAKEPLLVALYERFKVTTNIIQADLAFVKQSPVGVSICELLGEETAVKQAIEFMSSQELKVEVLGYA
jgi:D-methionine transport system ATP-binding protein